VLPAQIRKRQVKGTGGSFYQQVVRNNRNHLREQLADGLLVQQGYLDRVRLLDCLASEEPSLSVAPTTLLSYLAAEIWLQQMSVGVSSAVTSAQPLQRAAVV
jgi:hypothetical protein